MTADTVPRQPQLKSDKQSGILAVVLVYALFAACWILLSDNLVQMIFSDPKQLILASILKGWFFVGITSLLLYGLMQRWVGVDAEPKTLSANSRLGLPFISLLVIIVVFTGAGIFQTLIHHEEEKVDQLQAIADLKIQQIADWLRERQSPLVYVQTSDYLAEQYHRWQESGDLDSGQKMQLRLEQLRQNHGFGAVMLLNPKGEMLWGSDKAPLTVATPLQLAAQFATAKRKVQRVGPYRDAVGNMCMDFIAPLTSMSGPAPLVILHVDLADWLFPVLKTWPAPSASSETLLFQRDGDQILYLNELQHQLPVNHRIPIATEKLLAAQVLRGEALPGRSVKGLDYRGIPVIGVVRAIADTDWFLVVKINQSELYTETVSDALWIGFVGLLALFVAGAGYYLMRQGQQLAVAQAVQQSQAERLNAQHLLSSIADSSEDAIFAKDLVGRYILINRAASQFVGKSAEDILGQDDRAIFTPEQAERLMTLNRRVITENRTITLEDVLNTLEGERTFLATKGPLRDNEDNVIGVFGISRDITERKQAELALRSSEQRFRQLFSLAPMPLAIIAQNGEIVAVNDRFISTFGYTLEDVPTLIEWWPLAYPDPDYRRSVMIAWNAAVQRAVEQNTDIEPIEFRVTCKDGGERRVVISGIMIGTDVLTTLFDVTESRVAEEALRARERYQRAVLDNFPFMVWLKDTDSRILAANKTYARVANVADPDELVGKTDLDYWEEELAEQYRAEDRAVLQNGQSKMTENEITEAGRRFWIESYKSPVELDGHVIGTVGFARDITERKIAETELIQRNNELERFNRATVGRELDMIALKQQVNQLSRQLGQEPPYPLVFLDTPSVQQTTGEAQ